VAGPSSMGEVGVGDFYTEVNTAYRSQLQNTTYTSPLGTVSSKEANQAADSNSFKSVLTAIFTNPMQTVTNSIATMNIGSKTSDYNRQTNPLLKMKAVGDYTLDAAEDTYGLFVAAKVITNWSKGDSVWAKGINAFSGAADIADGVLEAIQAPLYCLLFLMFSAGFTLSIYLPMIPFIFWISAATTWLVCVLVGTTAGPLWAATHIGTEEDKGSRSAYGYIFLLDVTTRPPLMVFGFFFASLIVTAVGTLVNYLFAPAIANAQASSITGIVSVVGLLMIYARVNTTLVSRAFSLVVTMPDHVISWLGGREGVNMLSGMAESVQNMFVGFGRGAGNTPGTRKLAPKNPRDDNPDGIK
jgi:conjugal transfer/type IV secretion protein DotA/TraY